MLCVDKISKLYGKNIILNEISLNIDDGEIYGLVGKNGVGKTTLLNIIAGIIPPSAGECFIDGSPVTSDLLNKGLIGYLPDLPAFYDYLTVNEYLDFLCSASGAKNKRLQRIQKIVKELDINENAKIKNLSRGNKQKLGIVSAIIGEPKLILLDEPTSALDPVGRRDVMNLIKELREENITVILSTHILADLEIVCNRVGFLHDGIIKKEIDLKNSGCSVSGYSVGFASGEHIEISTLINYFPDFHVSVHGDKYEFTMNESMDQRRFFGLLAEVPYRLSVVEPVKSISLEQTMEEILAQ